MGFFDRFRKINDAQDSASAGGPLVFESVGAFEQTSCQGKDALGHLEKLRAEGKTAGFTPVLLGDQTDVDSLAENREFSKISVQEQLRLAESINVEQWLQERVAADPECYQSEAGSWPAVAPEPGSILAHLDILSRKPKKVVYIARIPTLRNWEAAAYVGMGGWNECPDPAVLTAFGKRWHEQYGAEIVSITHDVMEFTVAKPPLAKDAALALAREHFIFCSDIVHQAVGDIAALAATLLKSNYWYFWWD